MSENEKKDDKDTVVVGVKVNLETNVPDKKAEDED